MQRIGVLAAVLALSACVGTPGPAVFSPQQSAYVLAEGQGEIVGRAYLVRDGKVVATAAGGNAALLPATDYHAERMRTLYGDAKQKVLGTGPDPEPPTDFAKYRRITKVGADGRFTFTGVAPGSYYVITAIEVPGAGKPQLIGVYERVTVPAQGAVEVTLSGV